MTQFSTSMARRTGGDLDVYTGLLAVATLVLIAGIILMASFNIEHSATDRVEGGPFTLVP